MTTDAGSPGAEAWPLPAAKQSHSRLGAGLRFAGAIGRELSMPLDEMQAIVQEFIRSGRITRSQVQQLNAALDHARAVARSSAALARLHPVEARPDAEALRLDIAVTRALAERMPALQRLGIVLEQQLTPTHVVLDPELLSCVLDAAIECCARPDRALTVTLEWRHAPSQALLRLRSQPRADAPAPAATHDTDRLCWHVLHAMAGLLDTHVQHDPTDDTLVVELAFAPQSTNAGAAAFGDDATAEESWLHSESLGFGGFRLLLISSQPAVRASVADICESMGLHLTWAPSSAVAESQVAVVRPDLVLIDVRAEEIRTERLRQQLQADDPAFPWLRIEKESSLLSLEHWMSEQNERLTPHNLRAQLPRLLLLNLSRQPPR